MNYLKPCPKPEKRIKEKTQKPRWVAIEANPLEEAEQGIVVEWLRAYKICFHHSPNGGVRHITTAVKLKQQGTSPGFPDLMIFDPPPSYAGKVGVAIEMKRRKDSHTSVEQVEWLQKLSDRNWLTFVCKGADVAIEILETCGYGTRQCGK